MTKEKSIITSGNEGPTSITAKPISSSKPREQPKSAPSNVDIDFVFDTTGSMDDKIKALLKICEQFVDEARGLNLNPYFSLISFGDIKVEGGGDTIDIVVTPTKDIERIKQGLTHIPHNNGFGNEGESSMDALQKALTLIHRSNTVKIIILITDEPAHQHHITAAQMTKTLKQREYLVFVVATPHQYYKDMATQTGGTWREISTTTSLSDILDIFRHMAKKVNQVARDVHKLGGGSVAKYLSLKPPDGKS